MSGRVILRGIFWIGLFGMSLLMWAGILWLALMLAVVVLP